jgi:hypothetical protein
MKRNLAFLDSKAQELKAEGLKIAKVVRFLGVSYSGIRLLYEASEYPVVQRQAPGGGVQPYYAYLRELSRRRLS